MTNSNTRRKAETIIDEIFELTEEGYLWHLIDKPIKKATTNFQFEEISPLTYQIFLNVISEFVCYIYKDGLPEPKILSAKQAGAEALVILEEGYQNPLARGYYAAYLDASNLNQNGLELVLAHMAEFIINMARAKHIRWVYTTRVDPSDWPIRCLITEILLDRWEPFLPTNVLRCHPAQLAVHLPELINSLLSTDRRIRKFMQADIDFDAI